jgi:flagellar biosynthesis anti-sigma factor FlgM
MKVNLDGALPDPIIREQKKDDLKGQSVPAQLDNGAQIDKTTLHADQDSVVALTSQALTTSEVREEKIATLRQLVASGQYKVDPENVAEAILQDAARPKTPS